MTSNIAFWDTSAILLLCCQQTGSQEMRRLWRQLDSIVVWWGSVVEARSAMSRLQRENFMSERDKTQALARLDALRLQWREIMPVEKVRLIAESLPDAYGLRALDSFQLAAALVWCKENPKERLFVCLDDRLTEAAQRAGFTTL